MESSTFLSKNQSIHFQQIKAILFDLDGVLMMSNEIHSRAYEMVFKENDIHDFSHTEISGMRTDEVVRIVLERNGRSISNLEIARVTDRKRMFAKVLFAEEVPVIEGCAELLGHLKTRYSLALATSASHATANAFLGVGTIRSHFDFVICGPEVAQSKPHPEIYQRAMQALKVRPEECLVIEDSVNGVEAGKAAGAQVIGVEGTFKPEILIDRGAVKVLEHARLLPSLLDLVVR